MRSDGLTMRSYRRWRKSLGPVVRKYFYNKGTVLGVWRVGLWRATQHLPQNVEAELNQSRPRNSIPPLVATCHQLLGLYLSWSLSGGRLPGGHHPSTTFEPTPQSCYQRQIGF